MKKTSIAALVICVLGTAGYFAYQVLSIDTKIPELPVIVPAAASAGPEWVKNMKEQDSFHVTVTKVEGSSIYVEYANMPPSGVNVMEKETGEVIWRQLLTASDGYSGSTVITLPAGIANSLKYSKEYVLQAFGPDNYVYATSPSFFMGERKASPNVQFSVQIKAEPNEVREGEKALISWSSSGATGCYVYNTLGIGGKNDVATSGSEESVVSRKVLPLKITCHDDAGNEVSADLDLTVKP